MKVTADLLIIHQYKIMLLLFVVLTCFHHSVLSCDEVERDYLLSFISSTPSLNWSPSTNCCLWQGISCTAHGGAARVSHLLLQERRISGTLNASFLANLPFLAHINLSHNSFSGPFAFHHLHSSEHLQTIDLSSNRFNSSINLLFLDQALVNLITFNIHNNSFTGSLPSSICKRSPRLQVLDFSMNRFSGPIAPGLGECQNLQILRAGSNSLSGWLPDDLYAVATLKEISLSKNNLTGPINTTIVMLSNLSVLELNDNQLNGELPPRIGLLSKLERLVLNDNAFNGSIPPSLMDCSNLTALILIRNKFSGEISTLNFSKLHRLQVLDLGINLFSGMIPDSLCSCTSLIALRLAANQLVGEIPPCMASLISLTFLSLSYNNLSNVVGALKVLSHCHNLVILIMAGCFRDETMKLDDDSSMNITGFQNLEYLTLKNSKLRGPIPPWIARLGKLKILNLSDNSISGPIPSWLASMPELFHLDLSQNILSGNLPPEMGQMPGFVEDHTISNFTNLALPFYFKSQEYNSLFNMRRGLKLSSNNLSGGIPEEIGKLKYLQELDLSDNSFNGSIPDQLSHLTNLEGMNLSVNHLNGEIPTSLQQLHFMSSFSVAYNDLEGEIPSGGQFDTFTAKSFKGNPKLLHRSFQLAEIPPEDDNDDDEQEEEGVCDWILRYNLPLGLGYFVGISSVAVASLLKSRSR